MKKRFLLFSIMLFLLVLTGGVAAAQTSEATWFVRFWNNPNQDGAAAHTANVRSIRYNWGDGSPHSAIGNNGWSGRWTSDVDFTPGTYRFTTVSDDGVRLYFGDKHIILDWKAGPTRTNVATVSLSGGKYPVSLDYFEDKGNAQLRMYWEYLGPPQANSGYVTVVSSGTAANPPSGNWAASYWNNSGLQGSPVVTRGESEIDFDWGSGSPSSRINSDNWSARWTSTIQFPAGTYRFSATMDDGMRVWVDGALIVDSWYDSTPHTITADRALSAGGHEIRVEYYEHGGGALARLSWHLLSTPPPPPPPVFANWRGEYYNNAALSGAPVLVRNDANVDFNWGNASPAAGIVNADNFSVRWTRSLDLVPGRYRFTVGHDDGVRLWAGNTLLVDSWQQQAFVTRQAEVDWPGGVMAVKMEYYEGSGLARASLSWTRLGAGSDTGGQPTATVNTAYLNFRSGPGTNNRIITSYPRNTVVTLLARNDIGNWLHVMAPNGQTGWMHVGYLATTYPVSALPVVAG